MSKAVFRKTDAGKAEITRRSAGLAPATRRVLILVNGNDSTAALEALGLDGVHAHLDQLLALGLIEAVSSTPPVPVAPAAAPAPEPVTPLPAAPSAPAVDGDRLIALQRQAVQRLTPHFGPDTTLVARELLSARGPDEYRRALDGIQAKLAIYMGRKQAARELADLQLAG